MIRIGLISDTHGYLDPKVAEHFKNVDQIWHAGDIGTIDVCEELEKIAPLKAVYGNIDGGILRQSYPEHLKFSLQGLKIWITHIGGYPGRYNPKIREKVYALKPDLFICGHSHILKIQPDKKVPNLLHINPGAAGKHGFHKVKTLVRFGLDNGKIKDLEVIELGPRA